MALVKWQPGKTDVAFPSRLRGEMDRLFDEFFSGWPSAFNKAWAGETAVGFSPDINLTETDEGFHLSADLPGLKKEDIEVEISEEIIVLKGERKEETKSSDECFYCHEASYGAFRREVPLPGRIIPEKSKANLKDGVLSIDLPKSEESKIKHVKVNVE